MNKETKEHLNDLLKASYETDAFLNDDEMTEDINEGPSTRQMVINMIAIGLEETEYELVLQKK